MKSLMRPGTGRHMLWMMPEHSVTVVHRAGNHANGVEIVSLVHGDALALKFLPDGKQALNAAFHARFDVRFLQLGADDAFHLLQELFALFAALFHFVVDLLIGNRVHVLEGQVFELTANLAHAEAVRERTVDVESLASNGLLPIGRQRSSVRMLCRRSASLMRTTRISSTMASIILRTFSA